MRWSFPFCVVRCRTVSANDHVNLCCVDHERPEVVRRVGLALDTSGDDGAQLSFENLQVFSRHIVPFTPNKVKAAVLSDSFHELHDCLNAAHLSATGWSAGSYLKLISNTDARSWWADCIGTV